MKVKRPTWYRRSMALMLAFALLPLTAGLSSAAPPRVPPGQANRDAIGTWVGQLRDGSDAFVAIVSDGSQLVAYVCDDGGVGAWFFAAPGRDAQFQLANAQGALLAFTLGAVADGQFTKDSQTFRFTAHKSNREVLYRADALPGDTPVVAGWIKNGGKTRGTASIGSSLVAAPTLASTVEIAISPNVLATLSPAAMTPDTLAQPTANTTKFVWAAAGDSFASGEGNPERRITDRSRVETFSGLRWGDDTSIFVPHGSASLAADVTTCHRSDEAPAPKALRALEGLYLGMTFRLGFVACSGATTAALLGTYTGPSTTPESLLGHPRVTQPAQLDRIASFAATQGRIDALYMSIGGNDAGFGDIITACIDPFAVFDCPESQNPLLDARLYGLIKSGGSYEQVNARIETLFDPNLPVLIQKYPNPLHNGSASNPPACFGPNYDLRGEVGVGGFDDALQDNITRTEADWAFDISTRLNEAVTAGAETFGWTPIEGHLPAFDGHGICTGQAYINLNSAALRTQGRDIPESAWFYFSSGFLHPNNDGFGQMANATVAALRPLVDNVARGGLAAPANVRVAAATRNGSLTLRWNDRATSENAYEILVQPARTQDVGRLVMPAGAVPVGAGYRVRITGANMQQYVANFAGGGRFTFQVRACQTGIQSANLQCGAWSAQINGTNVDPAAPTGLRVTRQATSPTQITDTLTWSPQADAIEFVVRVEAGDGSASETRVTGNRFVQFRPPLGVRYKVAACNRVSCSLYVSP